MVTTQKSDWLDYWHPLTYEASSVRRLSERHLPLPKRDRTAYGNRSRLSHARHADGLNCYKDVPIQADDTWHFLDGPAIGVLFFKISNLDAIVLVSESPFVNMAATMSSTDHHHADRCFNEFLPHSGGPN